MSNNVLVYQSNAIAANALCEKLLERGYTVYDPIITLQDAYRHIARAEVDIAVLDEVPDPEAVSMLSDALDLLNIDHIIINSETFETRYISHTWTGPKTEKFASAQDQNSAVLDAMWTMRMSQIYTDLVGLAVA